MLVTSAWKLSCFGFGQARLYSWDPNCLEQTVVVSVSKKNSDEIEMFQCCCQEDSATAIVSRSQVCVSAFLLE